MLVTQAAFARKLGVSRQAVNQMIKMGRVKAVGAKVELTGAEAHLWNNTDLSQLRLLTLEPETPPPANGSARAKKPRAPRQRRVPEGVRAGLDTFATARAENFKLQSQQRKLDLQKQAGDLVARAELERALVSVGVALRERMTSLPDRIAMASAEAADPQTLHALVEEEIEAALDELTEAIEALVGP